MKIKIYLLIAVIFIAFSCNEKKKKTATVENKTQTKEEILKTDSAIIATLGSIKITKQTIQYRLGTESAYDNTNLNESAALIMIINDALEMEVALRYNQQALAEEIEQFKQYADQTSKAPEILNKVKKAYGQDIKSYNQWFISPKIVNRKIRDFFSASKSINQAALNQINSVMNILKSGKKMKDATKSLHLKVVLDSIPVKPLDMTPALKNYPDAQLPFENPMLKYVKKLKSGEMYPEVIEENYSFLIIKLLNYNEDHYFIERISVPKPDFDTWFKKEAAIIGITITDAPIKSEIQHKYSNLWWVGNLK
jgi:hypothetical protein